MNLSDYTKLRTGVQANARVAGPADVRHAIERLRQAMLETGLFADIEVGFSGDEDRLVVAMCTFAADVDATFVSRSLEQMWEDRVRYGFWEAHTSLVERDQIELQAATRDSSTGHYITFHVLTQRAVMPAQRLPGTQPSLARAATR